MTQPTYDRVSIWLHWLIAAAMAIQFATGWLWGIYERGSEPRFILFRIHIVVGSVIFALALIRISWRLTHKAPPPPAGMSRATFIASKAAHGLLYLAIIVQPLLGLLTITAFGKSIGRWPRDLHMILVNVIAAIILIHVAAAIWHQFVRRDNLMRRMLPSRI